MESSYDVDIEDGELESSDDGYTPLARPAMNAASTDKNYSANSIFTKEKECEGTFACSNESVKSNGELRASVSSPSPYSEKQDSLDQEEGSSSSDSSSSESSFNLKNLNEKDKTYGNKRKRVQRTIMLRVQPANNEDQSKKSRFKKYNVWAQALQEDTLTENMRGCRFAKSKYDDRNVENYDVSLKYGLDGENKLKRGYSTAMEDALPIEMFPTMKRTRYNISEDDSSQKSDLNTSCEPRQILDLDDFNGRDPQDVAQEIAKNLHEEKDELLVRIVETLGIELPLEIYKETQRIEANGGMMIKNGMRRRTPGGVFLFLLKNHESITQEEIKVIFTEERQNTKKWRKEIVSVSRDRKVEELKKRLYDQKRGLSLLNIEKSSSISNLDSSVSNPPPSPVGQGHSPEYKTHAINLISTEISPEKPSTSTVRVSSPPRSRFVCYDDDFLDIRTGPMDFL